MYQTHNNNYFSNSNSSFQVPPQQHNNGFHSQNINPSMNKIPRSVSNSNLNSLGRSNSQDVPMHVEYEVSMPVPIRHAPFHSSLWNIHQW